MARFEHIEYHIVEYENKHFVEFHAFGNDVKLPITWGQDARRLVESYIHSVRRGPTVPRDNVSGNEDNNRLLNYLAEMAQKIVTYRSIESSDLRLLEKYLEQENISEDLRQDTEWLKRNLIIGKFRIPDAYLNILNASLREGDYEIWSKVQEVVAPVIEKRKKEASDIIMKIAAVYDKHEDKRIIVEPRSITQKAKPMKEWWKL